MSCEMGVRRPAWWWYLEECEKGHEWAPGRVLVGWVRGQLRPGPRRSPGAGGLGSPQRGLPGARVPVGVVFTPGTSRAHRREVQPHRVGECHSDLMTQALPIRFLRHLRHRDPGTVRRHRCTTWSLQALLAGLHGGYTRHCGGVEGKPKACAP
jgi:hypothetical protein